MASRGTFFYRRRADDFGGRKDGNSWEDMRGFTNERFKNENCVRAGHRADCHARLAGRVGRFAWGIISSHTREERRGPRKRRFEVHVDALRGFRGTAVTETGPGVVSGFVRVVTSLGRWFKRNRQGSDDHGEVSSVRRNEGMLFESWDDWGRSNSVSDQRGGEAVSGEQFCRLREHF